MKRKTIINILLIVILILSIGGIYATWSYGSLSASKKEVNGNTIEIGDVELTPRGEIRYSGKGFNIKLDDKNYDHRISLTKDEVAITGGNLVVSFKPSRNTDINLLASSYPLNIELQCDLMVKEEKAIVSSKHQIDLPNKGTYFELQLNSDIVYSLIDAINIYLPKEADYNSFKEALSRSSFNLIITDDVTPA